MRWWLALAAASFAGFFALTTWSAYYPRRDLGATFAPRGTFVFITEVRSGSLLGAAGAHAGDRVVSMNGLPLARSNDLRVMSANIPADAPVVWQLTRAGVPIEIITPPAGRTRVTTGFLSIVTVAQALSLTLGFVIAMRRPHDRTALLGAWLLAGIAVAQLPLWPRSMAAEWRALPWPAGAMLWPASISGIAVPILLVALFARFRRPHIPARVLALALVPVFAIAAYVALAAILTVYAPLLAVRQPLPGWLAVAGPLVYPLYFGGAVVLLATGIRGIDDRTERRRARILLTGSLAGTLGLTLIAAGIVAEEAQVRWAGTPTITVIGAVMFCALPVSLAYATLRYRLFDLHVIVRLGLQYAVARGALLGLVPVAVGLLIIDVLRHGDQPLRQILIDRGWTYLVLIGAAIMTYSQRRPWMAALDRRFFREQYAAQQVLRQVVDEVARARDLASVANRVLARITEALHPRKAALIVRPVDAPAFEPLAVVPASSPVPPLSSTSALARIARALAKPMTVSSEAKGLRRDLPASDTEWLEHADVDLMVPVKLGGAQQEVLLVLGPRLSEEPYSAEDVELLSAVAASLALVDRLGGVEAIATPHPDVTRPAAPLSGRYRLDRLIGSGGMGTVWEARDESLDRAVAVKLLKGTSDDEREVERFKREARAAARLAHPNVVVVHDFGVDAGRPFLVMERLVGRTLRQQLAAERRLAPAAAVPIVMRAAAGVAAAHAQQLVHRDLKPENIFLCGKASDPDVKILDFGIARSMELGVTAAQTTSHAIAGTLLYMAPEQLSGGQPAPAWDIWALAVISYEMLTGAHPLRSADVIGVIPALLAGRFEAVRTHVPGAPESWQAFFDRALALDPARRPTTASEMADTFAAALDA